MRRLPCLLGFLGLACFAGCGTSIVPVEGTVTFEGQPVTSGQVNFLSPSGFGATTDLDSEGSFSLSGQHGEGIPPGSYKVSITPARVPLEDIKRAMIMNKPAPPPREPRDIPHKYRDPAKSGFSVEVKAGATNEFHFEMKGDAGNR